MAKYGKLEYFVKIRKPIPKPGKIMSPRKEHAREKNNIRDLIEEGIEEWEESKEKDDV